MSPLTSQWMPMNYTKDIVRFPIVCVSTKYTPVRFGCCDAAQPTGGAAHAVIGTAVSCAAIKVSKTRTMPHRVSRTGTACSGCSWCCA